MRYQSLAILAMLDWRQKKALFKLSENYFKRKSQVVEDQEQQP